ncbi:MAG TPA: hypothetical protein VHW26_12150 [Solirubrobacteraceae bacterium]|jgi:hypothetical protein|nr:hypothetical protein [Solirubrobacteraceae bacterium]
MRVSRHHTPARRDAAVLRLRRLNRGLVAVAFAGTAVLAEVAAHAFPGHTVKLSPGSTTLAATSSTTSASVHHHHHRSDTAPLKAPTTTPSTGPSSTSAASTPVESTPTQSTPVETTPVQSTPTPVAVTPAPVVSGGS